MQEKEGNSLKAAYHRAGNQIIYSEADGSDNFYVYNAQGNVSRLLNTAGETVADYTFDAFGVQRAVNGDVYNPFRYNGEYYDDESDSIYLRNRYYNPSTGRFLTEDLTRYNSNWYVYCGNSPVIFVDPSGLCEICVNNGFSNHEEYLDFCQQEDEIFENEILKHTTSSKYINIVDDGIFINIYAYVNIESSRDNCSDSIIEDNITYRQATLNGIRNGWTGNYIDENGVSRSVVVYILDLGDGKNIMFAIIKKSVTIDLYPREGETEYRRGQSSWAWTNWHENGNKEIGINCGGMSLDSIKWGAAHEFGHTLGLEDVYLLPESKQFYSIMCYEWDVNGRALQVDYAMVIRNKTYLTPDFKRHSKKIVDAYAKFYN